MSEQENGTERKAKGGPGMVLVLVAALFAGGGGGAAGAWFLAPVLAERGAGVEEAEAAEPQEVEPDWALFAVENLVVNPAGTQGRRFLVLSLSVEVDPVEALPRLEGGEVRVRDGLLRALGGWGVEELAAVENRAALEAQIREVVLHVAGNAPVGRIYFSQYVLQ